MHITKLLPTFDYQFKQTTRKVMKTLDAKTANLLNKIVEFIELTEGSEGLKNLTTKEGIKSAFEKYNAAYESFVTKFLDAPIYVKNILTTKMCNDVWIRVNTQKANQDIQTMIENA